MTAYFNGSPSNLLRPASPVWGVAPRSCDPSLSLRGRPGSDIHQPSSFRPTASQPRARGAAEPIEILTPRHSVQPDDEDVVCFASYSPNAKRAIDPIGLTAAVPVTNS